MLPIRTALIFAGAGLALTACGGSSSAPSPTSASHRARSCPPSASAPIRPADFTGRVDNPWFPLAPGSVYRFRGTEGRKATRERIVVTHRVKRILGVPNVVLDDRLYRDGHLAEKTTDWYTQDRRGNVWYFGEATATIAASGRVISREGSFEAGKHGARPGIFMPAHPRVGQCFHQERFPGHAEDTFRVASLHAKVRVPGAASGRALATTEKTVLEPGVLDGKVYVRGIGTVREYTIHSPDPPERLELVSHRP